MHGNIRSCWWRERIVFRWRRNYRFLTRWCASSSNLANSRGGIVVCPTRTR
ncbi:hypothetical protein Mapa_008210 [Marchantia paleacea]|nr:hypothetical protein Mapa_008210 [Marchantia paleacea]